MVKGRGWRSCLRRAERRREPLPRETSMRSARLCVFAVLLGCGSSADDGAIADVGGTEIGATGSSGSGPFANGGGGSSVGAGGGAGARPAGGAGAKSGAGGSGGRGG